jgi:hypothetical protein
MPLRTRELIRGGRVMPWQNPVIEAPRLPGTATGVPGVND